MAVLLYANTAPHSLILNSSTRVSAAFYILLLVFAFFILPFAYFYFEEDEEDTTIAKRSWGALKYTVGFMVVFIVLLTLGSVLGHAVGMRLLSVRFATLAAQPRAQEEQGRQQRLEGEPVQRFQWWAFVGAGRCVLTVSVCLVCSW